MILTVEQLTNAIGCHKDRAAKWLPHINATLQRFGIDSINEISSFLAQTNHESAGFSQLSENLNYSAEGLAATWPNRYRGANGKPNALALSLHRKPAAIANDCYAGRMGNIMVGDGWLFRGRGLIQITGRANYKKCGQYLGVDLLSNPDLLLTPEYASLSAGWFWHVNGLDKNDDDVSMMAETKIINGGTNGLADRQVKFNKALKALGG